MLSLFFKIWMFLITGIGVAIGILVILAENLLQIKKSIIPLLIRLHAKLCLIFHTVEVIGKENLLKENPIIIFANHQSNMDILLLDSILNIPFCWLAKDSLFKIPVFGWLLRNLGYIPVERNISRKAKEAVNDAYHKLNKGISIIIFPEGTWSNYPDKVLPFKSGLYHLARNSQKPLLPITIINSNKINPPDTYTIRKGSMKVIFHPIIYPIEYKDHDKDQFIKLTQLIIENGLSQISHLQI